MAANYVIIYRDRLRLFLNKSYLETCQYIIEICRKEGLSLSIFVFISLLFFFFNFSRSHLNHSITAAKWNQIVCAILLRYMHIPVPTGE